MTKILLSYATTSTIDTANICKFFAAILGHGSPPPADNNSLIFEKNSIHHQLHPFHFCKTFDCKIDWSYKVLTCWIG